MINVQSIIKITIETVKKKGKGDVFFFVIANGNQYPI